MADEILTEIVVGSGGTARCIYNVASTSPAWATFRSAGPASLSPTQTAGGSRTCRRCGGRLGPFDKRSTALEAELTWLRLHALPGTSNTRSPDMDKGIGLIVLVAVLCCVGSCDRRCARFGLPRRRPRR